MWRVFLLLLVFSCVGMAFASQSEVDSHGCNDLEVSQQVFECSKARVEAADVELNTVYKRLIEKIGRDYSRDIALGRDLVSRLKVSQRAWLALRGANCQLEAFVVEQGSIAFDVTRNNCLSRESLDRVNYLERFEAGL